MFHKVLSVTEFEGGAGVYLLFWTIFFVFFLVQISYKQSFLETWINNGLSFRKNACS